MQKIKAADVRPGDTAWRRDMSLDPRPVASVTHRRPRTITLQIGTVTTPEIPASWYTFTRA